MLNHRPHLVILVAAAIVASACSSGDDATDIAAPASTAAPSTEAPTTAPESTEPSTTAAPTTEPESVGDAPTPAPSIAPAPTVDAGPAWEPVADGAYDVGVATITLDDDPDRPLTVDVWFPIDGRTDADALHQYTLLPGVYYESPSAVTVGADRLADDGPFPLVVYSHGSGGLRYIHSAYTEALASHGYVVAAADHTGNTAIERITGAALDIDAIAAVRPADVRRLVDAFTGSTAGAAEPWVASVDPELVAVTGHSFGGFTSIAAVTGFSNDVATNPPDERIDAIIPLAPATGDLLLPDDVLATVDVPMLVIVGTDDVTTPVDPNVTRLWDLTTPSPAYRVELVAGEHQTFTDLCAYTRFLPSLPDVPVEIVDTIELFAEEGCSPGDIDDVRAATITNSYAIRFLDEVLRGGPPVGDAFPDDVIFQSR